MGKSRGRGQGGVKGRRELVLARGEASGPAIDRTDQANTIADYEARYGALDLAYETAMIYQANGRAMFATGTAGQVAIPRNVTLENAMVSHFHPGDGPNVTLSGQDVLMTLSTGAAGIRAFTSTGKVMTFLNRPPGKRRPDDARRFAEAYDKAWGAARAAFLAKHSAKTKPGQLAGLEAEYRRLHARTLRKVVRSLGYGLAVDQHRVNV